MHDVKGSEEEVTLEEQLETEETMQAVAYHMMLIYSAVVQYSSSSS